jgi:hypothetical protein
MRRPALPLALLAVLSLAFPATAAPPSAHWAFRPPTDPPVPAVKDAAWPKSPLDRFLLAKLEAAGLRPAPPADRRTLLRRATFDLTGLPPTPEEVEAFLADTAPDAFARVVDRLLASPAYGERWGRHWLDVARYADSNGLDENVGHGNAWRYRDYVIAAFNRDKPFDQFLLEQLAGDLLPPTTDTATRHERLIATGILALGPKVLAEVDERKMEMDIVDEQIDTVGRAVLGLTLGCARCHDHKFDPLTQEDYYALAGVFKSTKTMESFTKIARWHENSLASEAETAQKSAHDQQVARLKESAKKLTGKPAEEAKSELAKLEKSAPELPSAMGATEGKVADVPVHVRGSHLKLGPVVARRVPRVLDGPESPRFDDKSSGRLQLARWLARPDHPLTARVFVNRVWRWHFGRGIVSTPDNFGRLGEPPDNPELLAWLAWDFTHPAANAAGSPGWSVKSLHRLILLSATYQMASTADPAAAEKDPENRLHAHADLRRLEAEAVRDALLAVSGLLDPAAGGPVLHVKNREFLFDHTSRDTTRYDSRRRSVYLPVIRNHLYDVFQLFDAPDAAVCNGDRATTTVAPQALFLLNSDLVGQASDALADGLLKENTDDAGRVQRLYRAAYSRPATGDEVAKGLALVADVDGLLRERQPDAGKRRLRSWAVLAQAVLAANEFLYVR